MSDWPILSIVTFLPLVGAALLLLINGEEATVARNSRWVALWTSGFTFLVSLMLWVNFDATTADFQFVEQADWMPGLKKLEDKKRNQTQ